MSGEVRGEAPSHFVQRSADAERGHGGDRPCQSAGNDVLKIAEVGIDVERETVRGYPPADVYADGCDFASAGPHADQIGYASGFDAVIGERIDEGLLDGMDVGADVALPFAQIEDGVANQLAG